MGMKVLWKLDEVLSHITCYSGWYDKHMRRGVSISWGLIYGHIPLILNGNMFYAGVGWKSLISFLITQYVTVKTLS